MKGSVQLRMEPFIYIKSLIAFGQVFAQQSSTERKGFVIGVSVGMAFTSILGNTPNISDGASVSLPNLKINWMYNQDLALLITSPGLNYSRGDYDRYIDGIIPSVQYSIKPNLWISGWMYEYSIMKYLMPDGSSLEGIGIAPDIYKQNSKTTIDAGRNVVLEFVIEFLDTHTNK